MGHPPKLSAIILNAAKQGDLELLKKSASELDSVLGDGLPALFGNTKDGDGRNALHYAALGGKLDVLKYLIEEIKLDIDVKDNSGKTPLCCAAMEGRFAAVMCLRRMGANPEVADDSNMTPLHHAAKNGRKECIMMLEFNFGIKNIDVSNDFGSPLQYACAYAQDDTVKLLLLHYKANPNMIFNEMTTPLHASIGSHSWECVEHLLKAGADPNGGPDGLKPLLLAAERAETQIIKLLVKAGADPNVTNIYGLKPIEEAAVRGDRIGVKILFPVTSPIPSYVDWSIDGIMMHVNSQQFVEKMMIRNDKEIFPEIKSRGTTAFHRKQYRLAVYWYTQALKVHPSDAVVLSNRSLCYVFLSKGDDALEDAEKCVLAKPAWPKAHYRKGMALKLLNRLDEAADAFSKGSNLDPENKELEAAFREVSLSREKSATTDQSAV